MCFNGTGIWGGETMLKFFMVYPYLELHILFYSNGLAIWSGFPDNTHIKKLMADNRPFWPP